MPLAKLIPMTTLASILIIVSYNMGEWKTFYSLLKAPKSDIVILVLTITPKIQFIPIKDNTPLKFVRQQVKYRK